MQRTQPQFGIRRDKRWRLLAALALLWLALLAVPGQAETVDADLSQLCAAGAGHPAPLWQVSRALRPELWPSRLSCDAGGALRITVHPGDAFDPNPGGNPTERVEIQVRREVVTFDQPVWYRFRFRLIDPWQGIGNRTVINQVKQDIDPAAELPAGPCPSANPLFKIEARGTATGADFTVKIRGTADCRDGGDPKTICGPWHIDVGAWNEARVLLKPSQRDGGSEVRVRLNGRECEPYTGRLSYSDHGVRDAAGRPVIDAQPRFGIYRDALPGIVQAIDFADIAFWSSDPTGDAAWEQHER